MLGQNSRVAGLKGRHPRQHLHLPLQSITKFRKDGYGPKLHREEDELSANPPFPVVPGNSGGRRGRNAFCVALLPSYHFDHGQAKYLCEAMPSVNKVIFVGKKAEGGGRNAG